MGWAFTHSFERWRHQYPLVFPISSETVKSYKLHTGGDNVSDKKDFFSFSGLFHNLDTGNYLYATSYGSSEHFQSPLIFHTGFKSILEISTQWDEMRSCDLQDSSVS